MSQNSRNQGFSYSFFLMMKDPESDPDPYLSLAVEAQNIRIRIRNTNEVITGQKLCTIVLGLFLTMHCQIFHLLKLTFFYVFKVE
jgi:hypothetical protein